MRKADELGVSNIRFRQADILGLGALQERFHLIEAMGVLHHMENPMTGLQILAGLLEPQGFMRIGLYSRKARTYIEKARELIRSRGLLATPAGIRGARKMFFELAKDVSTDEWITKVVNSSDFYSLSNCRDLLFHVQETCYDLSEIASMLDRAGLRFLGFEPNARTLQQFRGLYSSAEDLADLGKWDEYENRFPDTFTGMYQFWCQKADSSFT
jgi:SAM-dependent methyltransferase